MNNLIALPPMIIFISSSENPSAINASVISTSPVVSKGSTTAPSKSDLQQVGIVLVRDRIKQATIGKWIPDMPWIAQAPLFMVFCGDHRRIRRSVEKEAAWPETR